MPIRLIDASATLGQIASTLADASASLIGTHEAPPGRTGVMGAQLAPHVAALTGQFQANANRIGTIGSTLADAIASVFGSVPPPAGNTIRFNPGHYCFLNTGSSTTLSQWLARIASLENEPTVKGVKFLFDWADVETATRGVYSFSVLDQIAAACAAIGKKVKFEPKFQYFGTSTTSPNGKFPAYLATIQSGSPGYTLWDGVNPPAPAGNLVAIANLWNSLVMAAFIEMGQACAERYNANAAVEMWTMGETSVENLPGSGFSSSNWLARLKEWATAMRAAWTNTGVRIQTNYLSSSAQMQELIAHCLTQEVACGGPDNYSRIYDSNPIFTGNVGGIDYRNRIPWVSENQRPASSSGGTSATSAQVYAHNESGALSAGGSTKPNYYVWLENSDTTGGAETWLGHILPFIRSINGACNTVNPYSALAPDVVGEISDDAVVTIHYDGTNGFGSGAVSCPFATDFAQSTPGQLVQANHTIAGSMYNDIGGATLGLASALYSHSKSRSAQVYSGGNFRKSVHALLGSTHVGPWTFAHWWFVPANKAIPGCGIGSFNFAPGYSTGSNWKLAWPMLSDNGSGDTTLPDLTWPSALTTATGTRYGTSGNDSALNAKYNWSNFRLVSEVHAYGEWNLALLHFDPNTPRLRAAWFSPTHGWQHNSFTPPSGGWPAGMSQGFDRVKMPGYIRFGNETEASGQFFPNCDLYVDDMLFQAGVGSTLLVIIGDAATLTTCTQISLCPVQQKNNTDVQAIIKKGPHASLLGKYIFTYDLAAQAVIPYGASEGRLIS